MFERPLGASSNYILFVWVVFSTMASSHHSGLCSSFILFYRFIGPVLSTCLQL